MSWLYTAGSVYHYPRFMTKNEVKLNTHMLIDMEQSIGSAIIFSGFLKRTLNSHWYSLKSVFFLVVSFFVSVKIARSETYLW